MQDFAAIYKKTFLYIIAWGLFTTGTAFLAGRLSVGYGLLLGTLASILCFLHLAYQVNKCAGMPPDMAAAYVQAGWLVRLSIVLLVLVLSILLPQVSFVAAIAGFFTLQIVLILGAFIHLLKDTLVK